MESMISIQKVLMHSKKFIDKYFSLSLLFTPSDLDSVVRCRGRGHENIMCRKFVQTYQKVQ